MSTRATCTAPAPDRLLHRAHQFRHIQIGNAPARRRLILPAVLAMQTLQQHAVVFVARQGRAGIANAPIRLSAITVRAALPRGNADRQHLALMADIDTVNGGKRGRINRLHLLRDLFDGAVTHDPCAYGTNWWADPKEQLVVVFMAQTPGPIRWRYRYVVNAIVNQAIVD